MTVREKQGFLRAGPWLDLFGVLRLLQRSVKATGGPGAWAVEHGISYEYVRLVLAGQRIPGPAITKALGLEKALLWRVPAGRRVGSNSRFPSKARSKK